MNTYFLGDEATLTAQFTLGGVLVSPDTVNFKVYKPDGNLALNKTFPDDNEVIEIGAGKFEIKFAPTVTGQHKYTVQGTGAVKRVKRNFFLVDELT